jgi:hypothetical protein
MTYTCNGEPKLTATEEKKKMVFLVESSPRDRDRERERERERERKKEN